MPARFVLITILLAACGGTDAPPDLTIDTLPGGTVLVGNNAPSGWSDSSGIALTLEQVIAPGDGEVGEMSAPREIAVLADGRIIVNDGSGPGILVFNADGSFDRVLGRRGEGPGEYGEIFSLAAAGQIVAIQECNKARATVYDLGADDVISWQSRDCWSGEGIQIGGDGSIWLHDRLRTPGVEGSQRALVQWTSGGEAIDTFPLPAWREPAIWTDGNAAVPIPYSAHSHDVGAPPLIWSGQGDTLSFAQVSTGIDTVRIATIPGDAVAIPDSLRNSVIERFTRSKRFADLVNIDDVPLVQPLFIGFSLDEKDRLWVHRPAPDGSVASFEVLGSDGIWLGTVAAPVGAARDMKWANGRFFRIIERGDGTPAIEIYRVEERQ